jgi:hypothetical protein
MALGFMPLFANYLIYPILINKLSASEFGILYLMSSISALIAITGILNLHHGTFRFTFDYATETDKRAYHFSILKKAWSNVLWAGTISGLVISFFLIWIADSELLWSRHILPALIGGIMQGLLAISLNFWRAENRLKIFVFISLVLSLLHAVLPLLSLYTTNFGLTGVLYAKMLAPCIIAIGIFISNFRNIVASKLDISATQDFSLKSTPLLILGWSAQYIDRISLEVILGFMILGIYSYIVMIAALLQIIYLSLTNGLQTHLYQKLTDYKDVSSTRNIDFLFHFVATNTFILIYILSLIAPMILKNPSFQQVSVYTLWSLIYFLTGAAAHWIVMYHVYDKKNRLLNVSVSILLLIQVVGYFIFIPHFGLAGVFSVQIFSTLVYGYILFINARKEVQKSIIYFGSRYYLPVILSLSITHICWHSNLLTTTQTIFTSSIIFLLTLLSGWKYYCTMQKMTV